MGAEVEHVLHLLCSLFDLFLPCSLRIFFEIGKEARLLRDGHSTSREKVGISSGNGNYFAAPIPMSLVVDTY